MILLMFIHTHTHIFLANSYVIIRCCIGVNLSVYYVDILTFTSSVQVLLLINYIDLNLW